MTAKCRLEAELIGFAGLPPTLAVNRPSGGESGRVSRAALVGKGFSRFSGSKTGGKHAMFPKRDPSGCVLLILRDGEVGEVERVPVQRPVSDHARYSSRYSVSRNFFRALSLVMYLKLPKMGRLGPQARSYRPSTQKIPLYELGSRPSRPYLLFR